MNLTSGDKDNKGSRTVYDMGDWSAGGNKNDLADWLWNNVNETSDTIGTKIYKFDSNGDLTILRESILNKILICLILFFFSCNREEKKIVKYQEDGLSAVGVTVNGKKEGAFNYYDSVGNLMRFEQYNQDTVSYQVYFSKPWRYNLYF